MAPSALGVSLGAATVAASAYLIYRRGARPIKAYTAPPSQPKPPKAEWEDPQCFGIGKEEAHASHCAAESRIAALKLS